MAHTPLKSYSLPLVSEIQNSEEGNDGKEETENPSPISGAFGMFSTISAAVQSTVSETASNISINTSLFYYFLFIY